MGSRPPDGCCLTEAWTPPSSCEEARFLPGPSLCGPHALFPMHSQPDPSLRAHSLHLWPFEGRNPEAPLYSEKLPWY